jgi:hypothetical protein
MSDHMDNYSEHSRIMPEGGSVETNKMSATEPMTSNPTSHMLGANDPDSPMNWPTHRRIYASAVAWAMAFTV